MNSEGRLTVKLIHCGNVNIANRENSGEKNIFFIPMGTFALADELKKDGVNAEIIHTDLEYDSEIKDILDTSTLDCVGLDCHWVNQSLGVLETAELIKKINPNVYIFLGGFTASLFAEEIVSKYPYIDSVIRGDGEVPVVELCRALYKQKQGLAENKDSFLKGVRNLVWRGIDNQVIVNEFSYVGSEREMEALDFVSLEALRHWENYRILCRFHTKIEPFCNEPLFFLPMGRGCRYACTFCGGNCEAQKKMNNRNHMTVMPADAVVRNMKKAYSYGFTTFFTSFEFDGSDEWYFDIFNKVRKESLRINFGYGSWSLPSKALIDALSESCKQVILEISPETVDHGLRRKNKDVRLFYTNEQLEECLDYASTKGNVKAQICFGYYLAGDTPETVLDTIRYIISLLVRYKGMLEIEYSNFSTDPGSLLFLYPEKYDIAMEVRSFSQYIDRLKAIYTVDTGQPADMTLFRPKGFTLADLDETTRKLRLFNYLFTTFRQSISYVLKKTCNPEVVINILDQGMQKNLEIPFSSDKVRLILTESLGKGNLLDSHLVKVINHENECQKQIHKMSKPTSLMFLKDYEGPENEKVAGLPVDIFESMRGGKADLEDETDIEIEFKI